MTAHKAGGLLILGNCYTLLECKIQLYSDTLDVKYSESVKSKWLQVIFVSLQQKGGQRQNNKEKEPGFVKENNS